MSSSSENIESEPNEVIELDDSDIAGELKINEDESDRELYSMLFLNM